MIYWHSCNRCDCDEGYIEESTGTFGEGFTPKGAFTHIWLPIYHRPPCYTGELQYCGKGGANKTIKEFKYARVNNLTLKRNIGRYNLPHIWDGVLVNTPELQIKNQWEPQNQQVQRTSMVSSRTCGSYINCRKHFPSDLMKPLCVISKTLS